MRFLASLAGIWFLILHNGLALADVSGNQSFDFQSLNTHESFRRYVLSEVRQDGGTLLLVIDERLKVRPVSQETIFRKLVSDPLELAALEKKFSDPTLAVTTPHARASWVVNGNPLWVATQDWSEDREAEYSAWIANTDLKGILAQVDVKFDCADLAILLRWVYARDHALPVGNHLAGSGIFFGNFSSNTAWDSLPVSDDWRKDERFKTALRFVLNGTYTHSIAGDLYPITVTRDWVKPGSILLVLYSAATGHTQVIKDLKINDDLCHGDECIGVYYGNEPSSNYVAYKAAWYGDNPSGAGGLARWRWTMRNGDAWELKAAVAMPGYSDAEYHLPAGGDFGDWVSKQLAFESTGINKIRLQMSAFSELLRGRIQIVSDGSIFCHYSQPCAKGSSDYGSYSTPERDTRMIAASDKFLSMLAALPGAETALKNDLESWARTSVVGDSVPITYKDFLFNNAGILLKMSADPNADIFARWGLDEKTFTASQIFEVQGISFGYAYGSRMSAVSDALTQCAKGCDPKSEIFKALDTTRVDQGLKSAHAELIALPGDQGALQKDLCQNSLFASDTGLERCAPDDSCNVCSVVFGHPDWFLRETSNPNDSLDLRYGYEAP